MRKNVLIIGHNDATQFIDIFNQYTRLFDKNKYRVTVAYLTGEEKEDVRLRTIAENVIFLNFSKKSIRSLKLKAIYQLLQLTRKEKFKIVICHRYKPSYIMLWVAQFCKIKALFFVMHELKTMSSVGRRLLIALLRRKNMLFCGVSNAVRDDMRRDLWFMPKEKVITLYNMMDTETSEKQLVDREEGRALLGLYEHDFIFGNIARLVPNKDQKTLLNAFARIKPDCPSAKLIIMGSGTLETALKTQAAELGIDKDVIFAGFVPNGFRYTPALDCFVLSSRQEAFGRVLLEAMIARIPIIAARSNGIPEVMGDEGILVPAGDIDSLAKAMKQIYDLSNEARMEQGERLYQRLMKEFSIPRFQEIFWSLPLMAPINKES